MLFAVREVVLGKTVPEVLSTYSRPRAHFFLIRTDHDMIALVIGIHNCLTLSKKFTFYIVYNTFTLLQKA